MLTNFYFFYFYFSFHEVFGRDINMTENFVREKLGDSDAINKYPRAVVTDSFVNVVLARYEKDVTDDRCAIMVNNAKELYSSDNINRHAIVQIAKDKRISYFLRQNKEKMISLVLKRFKK